MASAAEDIRGNMVRFFEQISLSNPGLEFRREGLLTRYRHAIPHPLLNRVLEFPADAAVIGETAAEYRNRGGPSVWVTWSDDPHRSAGHDGRDEIGVRIA